MPKATLRRLGTLRPSGTLRRNVKYGNGETCGGPYSIRAAGGEGCRDCTGVDCGLVLSLSNFVLTIYVLEQ
jgi:hypothetical protein